MKIALSILCICFSFVSARAELRPLIPAHEAQQISQYLEDICGDTYCEGEYDWQDHKLVCTQAHCLLEVAVHPHSASRSWLSPEEFAKLEPEKKQGPGWKLTGVELFTDFEYDSKGNRTPFQNTRLHVQCLLELPEDISQLSYPLKEEAVYRAVAFVCIDEVERALGKLSLDR